MSRRLVGICVILLLGVVLSGAATQEDFLLDTGEDLIDLCMVDENQPVSKAAFNFCVGFTVGTYRMLVHMTQRDPVVCLPENPPSRKEAVRMLVAWVRDNPQYHKNAPEDTVVRFILQQWPCPK
jgi:hypothetical protein